MLVCEKGFDVNSQVALRPSIQVTGFQSGYVGEGMRNSIPGEGGGKDKPPFSKESKPERNHKIV